MSVSIKVAIRCRPYTIDDKLGVELLQNGEENGEVNLLNSNYQNNRFAFSWAWWSAYGYKRHVLDDDGTAEKMKLINQDMVYADCGAKIMEDLMQGNAVVLFAYGLSGSGKTFTVFGPDAIDSPDAWFKHEKPHDMWGIFPRLAYELFQKKADGWKITMKYFQNVVDTVRDLMSAKCTENSYKSGMRKDPDGFMDVEWCQSVVLNSWDDLRKTFLSANAKKAIAPTQFNHQSTRGHCIMTLEVEMPHPTQEGKKQRGRVYVCDLAGTEPAGDIVYAMYKKKKFDDGTVEYEYTGPHPDGSKSKELQEQGKKINLSLSEMAQFFMKMASAVKKKTLKPGKSIPGCNSYFLCKYLKDTMLQAKTYLFCAIRPEVKYHNYTYSTLGFAKNASVIKLQPKKASSNMSPAEQKMMEELEAMKALVASLKAAGPAAGTGGDPAQVEALRQQLANKQLELQDHINNEGDQAAQAKVQEQAMEREKKEYGKRGISLSYFAKETKEPHFVVLDEDPFRSNRFMYILDKDSITIGPGCMIQPTSLTIVKDHCKISRSDGAVSIVKDKGQVYVNGQLLEDRARELKPFDRVVLGTELLLFRNPAKDPEGEEVPTAAFAANEYREGLQNANSAENDAMKKKMAELEEERAKFETQRNEMMAKDGELRDKQSKMENAEAAKEEAEKAEYDAIKAVHEQIMSVQPKIVECEKLCKLLNRDYLSFKATVQRTLERPPQVKVQVTNEQSGVINFLDTYEFLKDFHTIQDEVTSLKNAINGDYDYEVPHERDPAIALFDTSFLVGTSTLFLKDLAYLFETEDDEKIKPIRNIVSPFDTVGHIEIVLTPLADEEDDGTGDIPEILELKELVGKPWHYKFEINAITGLSITSYSTFCQYEFDGQLFVTDTVEDKTRNPKFDHSLVHSCFKVDQAFLDFLCNEHLTIDVFVCPAVDDPANKISSKDPLLIRVLHDGFANRSLTVNKMIVAKCLAIVYAQVSAAMEKSSTACTIAVRDTAIEEFKDVSVVAAIRDRLLLVNPELTIDINDASLEMAIAWEQ